jgi:hypothetical protein
VAGDDDGHVYFFDVGEVCWITSNVIAGEIIEKNITFQYWKYYFNNILNNL